MWTTCTLNMSHHNHYLCHLTHCIDNITPTLFMTSHSPYVWHRLHYTRHHILTFWPQTIILRISHPLYGTLCPLHLCHHTNSIDDITATICMISHPVYVRHSVYYIYDIIPTMYENTILCWLHHTRHMYGIICATEDVTSTLLQQVTIFMTSHPIQAYHHSPCIRHCSNCIFVITTSPLKSHPLLFDISLTICVTSYAVYIIISTAYVITLLYLWQHKFDIWNHIEYAVQNIHYPCDITVTSLCHQTHCTESITPTLCMTSHSV